jgi:hypothetical protein
VLNRAAQAGKSYSEISFNEFSKEHNYNRSDESFAIETGGSSTFEVVDER